MTETVAALPTFDPACPMSAFPIQIGGKWTVMIVLCLDDGPRRFGVLRRHLRPISTKVLAETLTAMGRDGLVRRCPVEGADDGGVEYELTPLGRTLLTVIEQAREWARNHAGDLLRARATYDEAVAAPPHAPSA
ncbi:helix-turn-helix domain-containing protein [Micromonospora sp. CPCC 205539]|uniref:winged helix-turn-helix transcriptional regulator n=1 Tax=Micromonospora sp. CPCC 205539 TaxID=3122408 RepID=UPI002FF08729